MIVTTSKQLGPLLQGARKRRRFTQAELGARAGLSQKAMSMFEAQPERSSVQRLFRILSALDLELVLRDRPPAQETEW
ncbi:MAG: helix-turn-helix domain-containing protein [Candidatus Eremiobacterota bacterium]